MWLVAGLGNPGEKYARTRHNVGFMVVDAFCADAGVSYQNDFKGQVAKSQLEGQPVLFLKPQTFMNCSGESIQPAIHFHKISPNNVIVIHDELDVPFGTIRIKVDGGHGGHNGIRDIVRAIGPSFVRIRVGVGRPLIKGTEADFVLNDYRADEKVALAEQIQMTCDAVKCIIRESPQKAQMLFNQKQSPLANKT